MQLSDFIPAGSGLGDTLKTVFFRMLPRGAQIEKVRAEINGGLLKKFGKITRLEIDNKNKVVRADLDLKGERDGVRITLSNYRLIAGDGDNLFFELGQMEVSREWLNAVLAALVKANIMPERLAVKNQLHQIVVKSLL